MNLINAPIGTALACTEFGRSEFDASVVFCAATLQRIRAFVKLARKEPQRKHHFSGSMLNSDGATLKVCLAIKLKSEPQPMCLIVATDESERLSAEQLADQAQKTLASAIEAFIQRVHQRYLKETVLKTSCGTVWNRVSTLRL